MEYRCDGLRAGKLYRSSGSSSVSLSNIPIGVSVTPTISISASTNNVCQGTSITFTASTTNGGSSPTYTWYVNGSNVTGVTGPTYTTSSLTNAAQVKCIVTSSAPCVTSSGATSNTLTMTINSPSTMTVTVSHGSAAECNVPAPANTGSYSAVVTNGPNPTTLTYAWKRNGSAITGTTGSLLVLSTVNNGDVISCVVSTSVACFAPATSNNFTVVFATPQNFSVGVGLAGGLNYCQGSSVTFTANPNQAASSYQWSMNGGSVSGATGSSFTTTVSSIAQLQSVGVSVTTSSSACLTNTTATGSNASVPFTITPAVTPTVNISANPGTTICAGQTVNFSAAATYDGYSPSFQWRLNGVNIADASHVLVFDQRVDQWPANRRSNDQFRGMRHQCNR